MGDQVDITPSGDTTPVYGTVGSISLIGTESDDVTTFPVVIDVTGNPTGLYAGATADTSIIVKQLNDVAEVPTAAISYGTNGQATVTKVVNGKHVITDVTVGAAESGETQITSGVKSGDKVLEREVTFKGTGGGAGGLFGGSGTAGRFGGSVALRRRRSGWLHRRRSGRLHRWRRVSRRMTAHSPTGDSPGARHGDSSWSGSPRSTAPAPSAWPRCEASACPSTRASTSPSSGLRARASPPSCTSSAASTCPARAATTSPARTSAT